MKTAAKDLVSLDGTHGEPIECNQLYSCHPCDPRRIGQLNEGRLPDLMRFIYAIFILLLIYNEYIKQYPNDANLWYGKGIVLYNQGKYDEAIKAYDETIRLDPKDTEAWNNKGGALNNLGKYDESIKCHDEAIRLDPNCADAWSGKGIALYNQCDYADAINALNTSIRLDPKLARAWYNKGLVLEAIGRTVEAGAAFIKANELGYSR